MQPVSVTSVPPQRANLEQHLLRRTLLLVLLIVLTSSAPAVVITYLQLEHQVWLRVEAAQVSTLAHYADERSHVEDMAVLVARRPTLCTLVDRQDRPTLADYLEDMRQGVEVDSLAVVMPGGDVLASAATSAWNFAAFAEQVGTPADFQIGGSPSQLLIVAARQLLPSARCDPGDAVLVVVRVLDNTMMQTLGERTGVAQSLIIGDVRVATSLTAAPAWPLNPSVAHQVVESRTACCTRGSAGDEVYFVGLAPVSDLSGSVVAVSEVALPGRAIQASMLSTIALLAGVTVLAALLGYHLTVRLSRHISQPLSHLAAAARRMGQGNLETRIVAPNWVEEIGTLARELERARQGLRRSRLAAWRQRERIEALLEATNDGVITLDIAGRVSSANTAAERILGFSAYDMLENRPLEVFRPAPGEVTTIAHLLQPPPGAPPVRRVVVQSARHVPITLEVSASWLTPDSTLPGVRERVIVFRDISQEAALETLRTSFLANVSHEFRTPLASVIASAEVLDEEFPTLSRDELTQLLDSIQAGTRHLRTLVDNLLESASVEAGRFRVSCRPTQLNSVLDELKRTMGPLLRRRKQSLEIDVADDLPTLDADPERLTQVLINLLANACKFAPEGKPITITVLCDSDVLTVSVLDCGPGLPTGDFGDLFQRFVSGPRTRGAQYGIGLGLWVVKAIIEAHGGQVGAENRPQGGACVWFTLPVRVPQQTSDHARTEEPCEGDQPVAQHPDRR